MLFERPAKQGRICLDFANTVHDYRNAGARDDLQDYEGFIEWSRDAGVLEKKEVKRLLKAAGQRSRAAEKTFFQARALREAIYRTFSSITKQQPPDRAGIDTLNRFLSAAAANAVVQDVHEQQAVARWTWRDARKNLEAPLWPIAFSAADLLTSTDVNRIRECGGDRCTWLFLDRSKNQSRRWCDMAGCGNRAKVRRHYAKIRSARES